MKKYRALTPIEITELKKNNCFCQDWSKVEVAHQFSSNSLRNVSLSGKIQLGSFDKVFQFPGGIQKKAGISNATIHNCTIESDTYINQVKNYLANYHIQPGVIIENVDSVYTDKKNCFGNGVKVAALNEAGGREISIYNELSAHTAYMMAMYRHRPKLIAKLQELIDIYCSKLCSDIGTIEEGARLINCGTIINTHVGKFAIVEGIHQLNNGTINSSKEAPGYFGPGTIAENFIAASGSKVSDNVIINNCFVGQGCELSKQFSAENSVFFANSEGLHGEACSVFAGPYTLTHHKSTLLIAGYFSFMNAGSGTNQSNHMYKLGPVHQGILERGSKTTSDSYLLWPARVGAFSLVMGRHYSNPDTSQLPFSYLIEDKDESLLIPGVNLRSIGTIRDAQKWPRRDKRKDPKQLDFIIFNLLSPYTVQKMIAGKKVLKELKKQGNLVSDYYVYNNVKITNSAMERGIELYDTGIIKFLGDVLVKKLQEITFENPEELRKGLAPTSPYGKGDWVDMAGLLTPNEKVMALLDSIENNEITDLNELNHTYESLYNNYFDYAWSWCINIFKEEFGLDFPKVDTGQLITFINTWQKKAVDLNNIFYDDARKEFNLKTLTGFGIDGGEETRDTDFKQVRGTFENHPSVQDISRHIQEKSLLADELKEKLIRCRDK